MKLILPFVLLAACNSHDPVHLVGKDGTEATLGKSINFASQSYAHVGFDKQGHPIFTMRDNSEAVPMHVADAAVTYGLGAIAGNVQKAYNAGEVTKSVATTNASVATADIATKVPLAEIATKVPLAEIEAGSAAAPAAKGLKRLFKRR